MIEIFTQAVFPQVPPSALTKYAVFVAGETVMVVPVPIGVPPQEFSYQTQPAPATNVPPYTSKTALSPVQK